MQRIRIKEAPAGQAYRVQGGYGGGARVVFRSGVQGQLLTGGSEAEKRRVQQDFLFARAMKATGRDLFPRLDPLTGQNLSRNDTFLRPDQIAALGRMGGHDPMSPPMDRSTASRGFDAAGAGLASTISEPVQAGKLGMGVILIGLAVVAALAFGVRRGR